MTSEILRPIFEQLGSECQHLISVAGPPPLGPGKPIGELRRQLEAIREEHLFPNKKVADRRMFHCCQAGLWLLFNFLDESHRLSQDIETTTGSYWHGVMHRREPDFGNSKYWFRRVGNHPVFADLRLVAKEIAAKRSEIVSEATYLLDHPSWDPFRFVDLCETAYHGKSPELSQLCIDIAFAEWSLLFVHCWERAVAL